MGDRRRLNRLAELRDILEDVYGDPTNAIKKEMLSNAIIKLADNQGVMQLLESQRPKDNIGDD